MIDKDELDFYKEIGWWWKEAEIVTKAHQNMSLKGVKVDFRAGLCPVCGKRFLKKEENKYIHRDYGQGAYMYHTDERGQNG